MSSSEIRARLMELAQERLQAECMGLSADGPTGPTSRKRSSPTGPPWSAPRSPSSRCSAGSRTGGISDQPRPSPPAARRSALRSVTGVLLVPGVAHAGKAEHYVSLGDSCAVGFQVTGPTTGRATLEGYANLLLRPARRRGWPLVLVNFGCGGATTTSILEAGSANGTCRLSSE